MPADEVHQTKYMLELSGFTHQNIISQATWSQEGGYKLGKSITGFPPILLQAILIRGVTLTNHKQQYLKQGRTGCLHCEDYLTSLSQLYQ